MPGQQTNIREREDIEIREPRKYNVIFHNDDFTTMDFVVWVLRQVFFLPEDKAIFLMSKVHREGSAVVGSYTYDVAKSKTKKAINLAREKGFPLNISIQPAD